MSYDAEELPLPTLNTSGPGFPCFRKISLGWAERGGRGLFKSGETLDSGEARSSEIDNLRCW